MYQVSFFLKLVFEKKRRILYIYKTYLNFNTYLNTLFVNFSFLVLLTIYMQLMTTERLVQPLDYYVFHSRLKRVVFFEKKCLLNNKKISTQKFQSGDLLYKNKTYFWYQVVKITWIQFNVSCRNIRKISKVFIKVKTILFLIYDRTIKMNTYLFCRINCRL